MAQRISGILPTRMQRRHRTEQHGGEAGQQDREDDYRKIQTNVRQPRHVGGSEPLYQLDEPQREHESTDGSDRREGERFQHEVRKYSAARGAECQTESELALPQRASSQQESR